MKCVSGDFSVARTIPTFLKQSATVCRILSLLTMKRRFHSCTCRLTIVESQNQKFPKKETKENPKWHHRPLMLTIFSNSHRLCSSANQNPSYRAKSLLAVQTLQQAFQCSSLYKSRRFVTHFSRLLFNSQPPQFYKTAFQQLFQHWRNSVENDTSYIEKL